MVSRSTRGISAGMVILLLAAAALVFIYRRTTSESWSMPASACLRYADALLFFRFDAAIEASTGSAQQAARKMSLQPGLAEMTREIAGFCWGTWRTLERESTRGDAAEVILVQSVDRMPEKGGPTRQITTRIRARLVRVDSQWKVSEWKEEDLPGSPPLTHRIRQLTNYHKGEPPRQT